jgi:hypothetical protein
MGYILRRAQLLCENAKGKGQRFSQELGQEIDFRSLQTLGWKYIN